MTIKAVTFDLWDTVIDDDSDEVIRSQMGSPTKREERHHIVWEALSENTTISLEEVSSAYDTNNVEFNRSWREEFVTWTVEERLLGILKSLGVRLSKTKLKQTIERLENIELRISPLPIEGVHEALSAISAKWPLAVVSDTINTPGRNLRKWLERNDLFQFFSAFGFSDEVGRSKPHKKIFEAALSPLGIDYKNAVHIGDRQHNDILGAQQLGMRAVLFIATRDTDVNATTADAICGNYVDLPNLLESLT